MIKTIIEEAAKRGHEVRIRDVAYALLRVKLEDAVIAFTVVFGQPEREEDVTTYESMDNIQFLIRFFEKDLAPKEIIKERAEDVIARIRTNTKDSAEESSDGSMTFEENRAGIEQQIAEILELKKQLVDDDGKVSDVKTMATLHKTEADLRAKLNDKFGASEKSVEQYVIVQPKYNHICSHTHKECYLMTEEYAMKQFHLIKDPKYTEQ